MYGALEEILSGGGEHLVPFEQDACGGGAALTGPPQLDRGDLGAALGKGLYAPMVRGPGGHAGRGLTR